MIGSIYRTDRLRVTIHTAPGTQFDAVTVHLELRDREGREPRELLVAPHVTFPARLAALDIAAMANYRANGIVMAIFGLTFGYSAYMSEVYRAGIQSISRGQMEAARSLGMTYFQAMRYVIIPQAVRVILPPVGNEFITLLKDTALVSAVSIAELTRRGREFAATNFNPIETYTMVALVYLTMTLLATRAVTWLEKISKYER